MIDQIIIGDKASFDDFGASLAKRNIGEPPKKSIKESVPFSNITYDFSAINGEIYWEERVLEYVFEITAPTPEKLEEAKTKFSNWVHNIMQENIYDPFIPEHHFVGTYDDMIFEDDDGLDKTTATVTFTAYPYKVANITKVYEVILAVGESRELVMLNESIHPVESTLETSGDVTIEIGSSTWVMSKGEYSDEAFQVPRGVSVWKLKNASNEAVTVNVSFCEEVF